MKETIDAKLGLLKAEGKLAADEFNSMQQARNELEQKMGEMLRKVQDINAQIAVLIEVQESE